MTLDATTTDRMIRRLRVDDLDALTELEQDAFDDPWSRQALADELAKPTARGWLLEEPGAPVAYALFQVVTDEAELLRIAVHPDHRRRGLGHQLLAHALDHLADQSIDTYHLEVRADNRAAHALYRGLGFEATGRRRAYYRDGCDALIFGRQTITGHHG